MRKKSPACKFANFACFCVIDATHQHCQCVSNFNNKQVIHKYAITEVRNKWTLGG